MKPNVAYGQQGCKDSPSKCDSGAGGGAVGKSAAFSALGAMLLGVIVTGLFVVIP